MNLTQRVEVLFWLMIHAMVFHMFPGLVFAALNAWMTHMSNVRLLMWLNGR